MKKSTAEKIVPYILAPALASCGLGGGKEDPDRAEASVRDAISATLEEVEVKDKKDNKDDIPESQIKARWEQGLQNLRQKYSGEDLIFLLKNLVQHFPAVSDDISDTDLAVILENFDLEVLADRYINNHKHVKPDGTVQFATSEEEIKLDLGDITPEDRVLLKISTQKLFDDMEIMSTDMPVEIYRLKKPAMAQWRGKEYEYPVGTFVVERSDGQLLRKL